MSKDDEHISQRTNEKPGNKTDTFHRQKAVLHNIVWTLYS